MSGLSDASLGNDEFGALLRGFCLSPAPLGLAVSGGPDSMALALLTRRWAERNSKPCPLAFIVDHALRAESAREAAEVKARLETLGIAAEILRWDHAPVLSALHDRARKARYRLLLEACRRRGVACLLFAHQREDQAETILMRLAKGSGIDGLAGMPAQSEIQGVQIIRPLLDVPKARLVATCDEAGIAYVFDPSNQSEIFARGRLRRAMPLLARDGLTVERLLDCGRRAAEARDALDHYTRGFLAAESRRDGYGALSIGGKALLQLPRAVALRALACALRAVHDNAYAPQHAALSRLLGAVADPAMPPRTLNGCLIRRTRGGIAISREYADISETLPIRGGETLAWDGRWNVTLAPDADPNADPAAGAYTVRALGNPSHALLDALAPGLRHKLPQGRLRATLPALWRGEAPALIPFSGPESAARASLSAIWPPVF